MSNYVEISHNKSHAAAVVIDILKDDGFVKQGDFYMGELAGGMPVIYNLKRERFIITNDFGKWDTFRALHSISALLPGYVKSSIDTLLPVEIVPQRCGNQASISNLLVEEKNFFWDGMKYFGELGGKIVSYSPIENIFTIHVRKKTKRDETLEALNEFKGAFPEFRPRQPSYKNEEWLHQVIQEYTISKII